MKMINEAEDNIKKALKESRKKLIRNVAFMLILQTILVVAILKVLT